MLLSPLLLAATFLLGQPACRAQVALRVRSALGHEIAGVLETPDSTSRLPTVVLISGAGPHDRDGYTLSGSRGHNDTFRALSGSLQERGFAVVRYDEIGTGASGGNYRASATTYTLADDVEALVGALARRSDVDASRIVLVGFSEGAVIAALVAQRRAPISAVALLAAPAWTGRRIIAYQDSVATADAETLPEPTRATERARSLEARRQLAARREGEEPWYRVFLTLDPLPAYRALSMPTLVLHGTEDRQVSVEQATAIASEMRAHGNERVTLRVFAGLGHALVTDQWARVVEPLSPVVRTALGEWLSATLGAAPTPGSCRRG